MFPDSISLFTAALFLATICLWWSTRKLWKAGERQLIHSEDTAKRQLRAYMSIFRYDLSPIDPDDDDSGTIEIAIRNFGETPAIAFTSVMSIGYAAWKGAPERPKRWAFTGAKLPIDVQPGQKIHRAVDFSKHGFAHFFDLISGDSAIYLRVKLSYVDVFGRRHEQTTCLYSRGLSYKAGDMRIGSQTRETTTEPIED